MKLFPLFTAFLLLVTPFAPYAQSSHKPLIPKDKTDENEKKNRLFVFIGEKIEVTALTHKPGHFDNGFKAKYKVLVPVYGYYAGDTVEFEAYDHYGTPAFSKYKNVMLFLSEEKGKYYHEKYQYFDVYKTKDGRWASPYAEDDYEHSYNNDIAVRPEKIEFATEVSYPLKIKNSQGHQVVLSYPEPYFKTTGDKAVAVYGNYTEELFRLKKEGILTARELFGDKNKKNQPVKLRKIGD